MAKKKANPTEVTFTLAELEAMRPRIEARLAERMVGERGLLDVDPAKLSDLIRLIFEVIREIRGTAAGA